MQGRVELDRPCETGYFYLISCPPSHRTGDPPLSRSSSSRRDFLKTSAAAACAEAKKKNLAVVSGLCWRYKRAKREAFKRIHGGEIGDIVALHCTYNANGLWSWERRAGWSDTEYQLRNWLYYTWLSGDHIVEQHVHSLDKAAWVLKNEYPTKAVGLGGRQVRTGAEFGHIFDHHAVVYEYASGARLISLCR